MKINSAMFWFDTKGMRRLLVASLVAAVLLPSVSSCDRASPKMRIVILTPVSLDILNASIAGIKRGLSEEGYGPEKVDLKEINAAGQMHLLSGYAREIAASKPDVIVPVSTPATAAVVSVVSPSQNVVFSTVTDPAKASVPADQPNITGVSDVVNYKGNVDLLRELFPNAKRVGTIYNPGDDAAVFGLDRLKPLLADGGFTVTVTPASNTNEAVAAARSLVETVDVILIGSDSNAASAMAGISAVAIRAKIPVIASDVGSVRNGALAAVSVDYEKLGIAGARMIAEILRSKKPAGQIPKVAFVGDSLILNSSTAKAMSYTFPPGVLQRNPQLVGTESP